MMVARRFPPDIRSGSETVFANLYQRALRHHEVRLVVGYVQDRTMVPDEALGVDLRSVTGGKAHWAIARAAARECRRFKPDVVLSNSIEATRLNAPTGCIIHDLNFGRAERSWQSAWRERAYRFLGKRLDLVVVPSATTGKDCVRIGIPESRIRVIGNGVDTDRFCPTEPLKEEGALRICYPGRILPGKGQHIAIDAIARLNRMEKQQVHLSIVGSVVDPIYLDQLKVQAFQQPVSFHLDVEDIVPYYQRAQLVIYPTLMKEGFGFTAVEAMSCGVPVAWSEQEAIREATGGFGFPFSPGDAEGLRNIIRRMLSNAEEFVQVGQQSMEFIREQRNWSAVWGQYERALHSICR